MFIYQNISVMKHQLLIARVRVL